jgi:hypothetical protein
MKAESGGKTSLKRTEWPWIALRTLTGVCALFLSVHGLWNLYGLDLRIDTLVSVLYCLLPFLSFFVFLFVKTARVEVAMHALIALGYATVYSILNWRTCSGFGDCISVGSTIAATVRTKSVLAALAVVILSGVGVFFDVDPTARSRSGSAE